MLSNQFAQQGTVFLLGSSHHTAPLEIREQVALRTDLKSRLYERLLAQPGLKECLILNTCNRVEIYGVSDRPDIKDTVADSFYQIRRIQEQKLAKYIFWKTNQAVIHHIFRVTAGLDSQMVGETEILGQVKQTYSEAIEQKVIGPILNRIFQKSFQAAKWARTHTAIGRGQVSIGNITSELAMRVCGELENSSILTIGSGSVGKKATQSLVSRGGRNITIANRHLAKARNLADEFKGAAVGLEDIPDALPNTDIIICCTASETPVLTLSAVEPIMRRRATRPLFIIDLSVPRNVEKELNRVDNVYLYNIDDIAKIANENLQMRMSEMSLCCDILKHKADNLWACLQHNCTP